MSTINQLGNGNKKIVRPNNNGQIVTEENSIGTGVHSSADASFEAPDFNDNIKDYLSKIRVPDVSHRDDIYATPQELQILRRISGRFRQIVFLRGDANFSIMNFDEALNFAKTHAKIEPFDKDEIDLMELLFSRNAREYGFYGEKQSTDITDIIDRRDIYKVPYSGNFLFRGISLEKFDQIQKDMGQDLILTSGIRSIVKQFYLFINKALRFDGNLSLASRSLAPPGYSYHANGDFDVGQRGFGAENFTENFLDTSIYKNLSKQGYVQCRYGRDNLLGVRFEPWHIKVI
ncbi:MAG TPA: peptidase M15 [Desulfobulbaceae bacterium]|nr:peptidase M15 [Desulfobulbaceae bacterium]